MRNEVWAGGQASAEQDRGRRDSFVDVYERDWPALMALTRLLFGVSAPREAIVRDAFVQLYRNWNRVERPGPFLRRAAMEAGNALTWRDARDPVDPIMRSLHRLDPRQRAATVLRHYEGLSDNDIARLIGCRPGTVRLLLAQSRTLLPGTSTVEGEEHLRRELRAAAAADPDRPGRPTLGELLANEHWQRPGLRSLLTRTAFRRRRAALPRR